jgi:hypothetical protein
MYNGERIPYFQEISKESDLKLDENWMRAVL